MTEKEEYREACRLIKADFDSKISDIIEFLDLRISHCKFWSLFLKKYKNTVQELELLKQEIQKIAASYPNGDELTAAVILWRVRNEKS